MSADATISRMERLAQSLLAATEEGRVEWSAADDTQTTFSTARSAGSVVIESHDRDGAEPYILTVFDSSGRRVETLESSWDQGDTVLGIRQAARWNDLLRNLYEAARRRALNIDTVLDALINDLEIPF